ncbi:MAG TPA: hypothetical protein VLI92_03530 [Candidatus Saccharimonadales bacterium]|nr:hypothetical protein [Candidatus Saccharimonadales bacterium]
MESDINHLKTLIDTLEKDLRKARELIKQLETEVEKKPYKDIPGVEGTFDGFVMTTDAGEKIDVPANYAAKTKLLFGDRLKLIDEEGKKVFKNISKQPRKLLDGVLNRKEGKWYALTDKGTYRVSDTCVEFNKFSVNDRVTVAVPESNFNAPFAAIEIESKKEPLNVEFVKPTPSAQPVQHVKILHPNVPKPVQSFNNDRPKRPARPSKPSNSRPAENSSREFVSDLRPQVAPEVKPTAQTPSDKVTNLLDDDDLR